MFSAIRDALRFKKKKKTFTEARENPCQKQSTLLLATVFLSKKKQNKTTQIFEDH